MECKTGAFIQRFWYLVGILVVTEGGDELVENNTDRFVNEGFTKEFYGRKLVERYFEIGIGISCIIIKSSDCKPLSASIYVKYLPIRISLAKPFEGVPALITFTCWNVEIEDLEDISIY